MNQAKNSLWKSVFSIMAAIALCAGMLAGCSSEPSDSTSDSLPAQDSASSGSLPDDPADSEAEEPIDFSAGLDERGAIAGLTALDYVTLPADYAAIPVDAGAVEPTDEDVQGQIDGIAAQYAVKEQITDRAVEDGEYVNIDYSGSVDGEKFEGGTASGARVLSGSQQFIDDFLTQIIGHMPGETFDVNVTFPDPYENNPDLANKDAVFEVTINYIEGEDVIPEFDDAFVAENLSSWGWETVSDAEQEIREVLRADNLSDCVWQYMLDNAQINEIPQEALDYQADSLLNSLRSEAQMYGIPLEYYLQAMAGVESVEGFLEQQEDYILSGAQQLLIIQAIREDAGIEIEDADLAAYFLENMGSEDYAAYEEAFGRPYLCMAVAVEKVNALMTENAVVE